MSNTEPAWWVRDILVAGTVALIVSVITAFATVVTQQRIDDARTVRELQAANLAFVRERSSADPGLPRPFAGLDLRDQHLAGLKLRNADLSSANLSGAKLRRADLKGAVLESATLNGADLLSADLIDARMRGATLRGANLMFADMSGADLTGSDFGGSDLYGAEFAGADLYGADFTGADLRAADLSGRNLSNADLNAVCWEQSIPPRPGAEVVHPDAKWPRGFTPPPSTDTSCNPTIETG